MKKVGKILLVIVCILGIAVCGIRLAMKKQVRGMYGQLDAPTVVALDHVADGTYEGRNGELASLNVEWVP